LNAVLQHAVQLADGELQPPTFANTGWDCTVELLGELLQARFHLGEIQLRDQQPYPAVDIVPDAAGRNDPLLQIHRRNASNWEAVALVHIGHNEGSLLNPRQRCHVQELLDGAVLQNLLQ
jgi:hypothetical protein